MRIGVVSDTHGIVPAWMKAMEALGEVDMLIHAGDILYHPPRLGCTEGYDIPRFAEAINDITAPILAVRGNCDAEVYAELLGFSTREAYMSVSAGGFRVVVNHGHALPQEDLASAAEEHAARVIVTGHTHVPAVERLRNGIIHLNPGSPAHPKLEIDGRLCPTVAIIDGTRIAVIDIESGEEVLSGQVL